MKEWSEAFRDIGACSYHPTPNDIKLAEASFSDWHCAS
jgi:hypothetical protein